MGASIEMNWGEYFNLVDNVLYWRERPERHFSSKNVANSWNKKYAGLRAGCVHANGKTKYIDIKINGKAYRAHNIIFSMTRGPIPNGMYIDHIDGNGLNNSESNLRAVTHRDNCKNRSIQSNNTSGIPGVTWREDCGKWRVRINFDGKRRSLGSYISLDEALVARKMAEKQHGYHANHGRR